MNQSHEIGQPYKGQKFPSFEHLKKYLEEYGQRNYVKFWIRSSHTRNSHKSKISQTMNPDLKYVSVKFACIFGGEKIRCRGSGKRKSSTYRNLGCPCTINAVVGEDGNHVKLDTVVLEHNHSLCKTLYDSLKKTKRKSQPFKNNLEIDESSDVIQNDSLVQSESYLSKIENVGFQVDWLSTNKGMPGDFKEGYSCDRSQLTENCIKDIEDKYGKIVKILVVNSENRSNELKKDTQSDKSNIEARDCNREDETKNFPEICRLCLSSKDQLSPIFDPNYPLESTVLSFKIMGCASIEISCNDGLPNSICTTCVANLNLAYNFRITCEKSDSILREKYAKSKILAKDKDNFDKYVEDENSNEDPPPQETLVVYSNEETEKTTESHNMTEVSEESLYLHFAVSCPVCSADFETFEAMLDHLRTHKDSETFLLACSLCTLVCASVKDMHEHLGEHLKRAYNEVRSGVSEMTFSSAEEPKGHESPHEEFKTLRKKKTPKVKYLCNVCGKAFKTKDRFQAHRNMHEGVRPYLCPQCGRGFSDRKNFHQHYDVVHLRKVRHECPVCQRKFYTRTKMRSHMTMHSGDKPFTCDFCGKTFRLKMNMSKHMKTHTNDRPYRCDKCGAAFIDKNLLKRHSYRHGGVRPFRCPVCGHGFAGKFYFKRHLKYSKCRGVIIEDPENYQWVGTGEQEKDVDDGKCIVVYRTEEEDAVQTIQGEVESISLDLL